MRLIVTTLLLALVPATATAFEPVREKAQFVTLIEGKKLTRIGITLHVSGDGQITGRAYGQKVRGSWRWNSGYFCRDLFWGARALGHNCQAVRIAGTVVRFTSDRGKGPYADLRLR